MDLSLVKIILQVLLAVTGLLVILLVLLHKGKGGGLSDMFGGGISSGAGSSGVAERNLNRLTLTMALIWALSAIALGVLAPIMAVTG
ncbi:preprotein translocase subunit SecG [Brachybacterium sp. AOP25-B2-12]|uniref:preprotein translocase subunit SecG n=1 Tax=Brachybacterium sp. AOP25-B2-12 TaxID=3457710 RepID=UPI004034205F